MIDDEIMRLADLVVPVRELQCLDGVTDALVREIARTDRLNAQLRTRLSFAEWRIGELEEELHVARGAA